MSLTFSLPKNKQKCNPEDLSSYETVSNPLLLNENGGTEAIPTELNELIENSDTELKSALTNDGEDNERPKIIVEQIPSQLSQTHSVGYYLVRIVHLIIEVQLSQLIVGGSLFICVVWGLHLIVQFFFE